MEEGKKRRKKGKDHITENFAHKKYLHCIIILNCGNIKKGESRNVEGNSNVLMVCLLFSPVTNHENFTSRERETKKK
jgi:hypothetical protein